MSTILGYTMVYPILGHPKSFLGRWRPTILSFTFCGASRNLVKFNQLRLLFMAFNSFNQQSLGFYH
jgi:hypothetical protein